MTATMSREFTCEKCGQHFTLHFRAAGYKNNDDGTVQLRFETTPDSAQLAASHYHADD